MSSFEVDTNGAVKMGTGVLVPQLKRIDVGGNQLFLALELVSHQILEHVEIYVHQGRQSTHIDDILEQQALAGIGVFPQANIGERYADVVDILTHQPQVQWLGGVIDKITPGFDLGHVTFDALWIDTDHDVGAPAPPKITVLADANLVPGGHALDIGRKDISWADGDAHPEDGLGKHTVGAGRASAIHVGKLYDEVINGLLCLHGLPALVTL